MIRPLSGLDAIFLYAETPTTPMNVVATVLIDGPVDYEALVARIEARLADLAPFRRRLLEMPLGLDHPAWIDDPAFDVRDHVARVSARPPGDERELEQVVARLARHRLDRSRPLWDLTVVDGLEGGRTALVVRAHHAAVDGVSGAAMLLHLFDRADEGTAEGEASGRVARPEAAPDAVALLRHGLSRVQERTLRWGEAAQQGGRSAAGLVRGWLGRDASVREAALPFQAPPSPFNGPLSPRRSVAYARTSFEAIQRVRAAFGGTVNDVVLAACTRALQGELSERRELPDAPLLAAVPVSTRSLADPPDCGNRLSAFVTELPVQLEDPVHQLAEVRRASRRAKRFHAALGERTLASLAEMAAPGLTRQALALYGRLGLAGLHRPLVNLTVSNVPGPPVPLSLFGQRVDALRPHGPLMEGTGLNVTVLSYAGQVDVGILACGERVPEAHRLAGRVAGALEELAKLAEAALPDVPPLARHFA